MIDDTDEEIEETEGGDAEVDADFDGEPDDEDVAVGEIDDVIGLEADFETATEEVVEVEDDDDDDDDAARPRARKVTDEDEDEDEDPDDVEADLDAILRDRLAASDDDDEDEEAEEATAKPSSAPDRGEEVVCQSCFLLVNRGQVGPGPEPRCPHCGELIDL